jgi:hypothetical protein
MSYAPRMAEIPIRCDVASAVILEDGPAQPRILLLRRSKQLLLGEWGHVAGRNTFIVVPVFVAYVDSSQAVRLNSEHSEFRWVTIAEAQALVPFGGQRRVYEEVQREFIDRRPSPWHEIAIAAAGCA